MGTELTRVKPAPRVAPPSPIPRKRMRKRVKTKRDIGWKWLGFLALLVFGLAVTAQIIIVHEDLKRLTQHGESDAWLYGIASLSLMIGWVIEEIYEEDWTGAFRAAASVFFFYCYNEGFESAVRSATGHDLPQWHFFVLSPIFGDSAAKVISVIGTVCLAIALLWAFDKMGQASVSMGFHAYDEHRRNKEKARAQ